MNKGRGQRTSRSFRLVTMMTVVVAVVSVQLGFSSLSAPANAATATNVMIDSDMYSNVDDALALASAFALQKQGKANVLSVTLNSKWANNQATVTDNSWKCAQAIAQFYDVSSTKYGIAAPSIAGAVAAAPDFTAPCAAKGSNYKTPGDAIAVMKSALSSAQDNSVVMVSIGYYGNLADLIDDSVDPSGKALVQQKVKKLVAMGGKYPASTSPESNFKGDVGAAAKVAAEWPTPIVWNGSQIGDWIDVGTPVMSQPDNSPVRAALTAFNGGVQTKGWDPSTVLYALGQDNGAFTTSPVGTNVVIKSNPVAPATTPLPGDNVFTESATGVQQYVKYATTPEASSTVAERAINALLSDPVWVTTTTTSTTTTTTTTTTPAGNPGATSEGYRLVSIDGAVEAHGLGFYGDMSGKPLNGFIINAARTGTNQGYWLLGVDGGIFSFGDADFYGSMGGKPLNEAVVGMASTPTGKGYWLVAEDGGIFSFGDADFYGSMGGKPLNAPIVGMAPTKSGKGYWLVAEDGGIFSFGDADFYGSMGGKPLNAPIAGMTASPNGDGYRFVALDGGIFSFGKADFYGSMGGKYLSAPIAGMTATTDGEGYWLVGFDGAVYAYGKATVVPVSGGTALATIVVALA